jgi:hypothetical protein
MDPRHRAAVFALAASFATVACGARSTLAVGGGQGGDTTTSTSAGAGGSAPVPTTACLLVGGDIDVLAGETSARDNAAVATLGGNVVVFGGYAALPNGSGEVDETWVWDGATWTQEHQATSPSARTEAAAATLDGSVVLFGGAGPFALGDTWLWNGAEWTQAAPAHSPAARSSAAMGTVRGKVVLFGGAIGSLGQAMLGNDTWQWDGADDAGALAAWALDPRGDSMVPAHRRPPQRAGRGDRRARRAHPARGIRRDDACLTPPPRPHAREL